MLLSERTVKLQSGDLKSRIDACQKDCASLRDRFNTRLHVDTNIQVKEMKVGIGTFLLVCSYFFSDLITAGIGRMLNAIKDDKLGTFESHSFYINR